MAEKFIDAAYARALTLIEKCRNEKESTLDLNLGLTSLPPEIGKLTALTELSLSYNQLTSLPPEIGKLTALTELSLRSNRLASLRPEIGQLTAVTRLNLYSNQLTSLPPEIGKLTAMTSLDLDRNQLTSLPPEIGQLTTLTELSLHSNRLTSLPPEIGKLTALTELNLDTNQLTSLPPEIGKLTALTKLSLRCNRLTSLPPEIGQLTALTELSLYGNQLTSLPPKIGKLTAMTKLDLSNHKLTSLPAEIGQLSGLTNLDLSGNQLTSLPPEIGQLSALTELKLNGNQLTSLPPEIGQLTALTELSLYGNQLTSLPPEIGQLTALTELSLYGSQLTSLPPEIGQLSGLTELNLRGNQLTSLPAEIGQLSGLTRLYAEGNQLTSLPPEIGQLSALTGLVLSDNQLTVLPAEIGQLTGLTFLYLSGNQLTSLPPEIGQLSALTMLSAGNQLTVLPPEIGKLTALTDLHLAGNQLTVLPPEIGKLTALTKLELNENQLTSLPAEIGKLTALETFYLSGNRLRELPAAVGQLTALKELFLGKNQLTALPDQLRDLLTLKNLFLYDNHALQIPENSYALTTPKAILDYYFAMQTGKTRSLNEVKLILVGRGRAGKTSTVRALRGLPFQESEESTPGIALCDWAMDACKGEQVTAHVWDFAGQAITHALHQFFFSMRSLYVLVLTADNDEREDAEYWLRLIKAFGTDDQGQRPPVFIALNKWNEPGCRSRVDRGALVDRYPFIRGFVETDCKTKLGIAKLKAALCKEVDDLPWVREPFPEKWDNVRLALSEGKEKRAHLTYAEYRALCVEHGVTDEGQQNSLSEILHNLGASLNYRNDPRFPSLREATVLQPEWLTNNIYGLVRHAETQDGVLKQADVDQVLSSEENVAMRAYLVQLMERFEIAYVRPSPDDALASPGGVWVVPQALPKDQPPGVVALRDADDATRLRYTYQALPEGLVARAIVRLHEFIEEVSGKKQQWAGGAILTRQGARALIHAEPLDQQVVITVTGPTEARRQLAGLCRAEMHHIHNEIRGLDPIEETKVQDAWIANATLEMDERRGRKTAIPTKDGRTVDVDPAGQNNMFSKEDARSDAIWKPTVFISYSKSNLNQKNELDSLLKILKNEGLLASHWHDRLIDPGDKWDETIQYELAQADVVIILVSRAALSTDYITDIEIPKALELHEARKTVVVPVILEQCRWDMTALGRLNALPEKARPLTAFKPHSNGWNTIADGLAKVFKKLMETGGTEYRNPSRLR